MNNRPLLPRRPLSAALASGRQSRRNQVGFIHLAAFLGRWSGRNFDPRSLFSAGQQGGLYEPSDPAALLRRRNWFTYSETFAGATPTNVTRTINAATLPDGTAATKLEATATAATVLQQTSIIAKSTTARYFIAVKKGTANNVANSFALRNSTTASSGDIITIDYDTGVLSGAGATTQGTAHAIGSGWYLLILVRAVGISVGDSLSVYFGWVGGSKPAGEHFFASRAQVDFGSAVTTASVYSEYQPVLATWEEAYAQAVGALTAQWQDSAGITPVTGPALPCGLLMDGRFGLARGPDAKSTGVIGLVGAATAATYSTSTGAGSVSRAGDASNQSFVTVTATANVLQSIRLTVSGAGLTIRQGSTMGSSLANLPAGFDGFISVTPGIANLCFIATSNVTTATFTLSSCVPILGNHLIQATSAARPTVSARVNLGLLTRNIGGTMTTSTPTANAAQWNYNATHGNPLTDNTAVGPDGAATAATLTFVAAGPHAMYAQYTGLTSGVSYKFSIKVKLGTATNFCVTANNSVAWDTLTGSQAFDASNGGLSTAGFVTATITTTADAQGKINIILGRHSQTGITQQTVGTVFVCDHDFRTADDAAKAIPPYQRVNTATDYDANGFPFFDTFDGVDDHRTCVTGGGATAATGFFWCGVVTILSSGAMVLYDDRGATFWTGISVSVTTGTNFNIVIGNGGTSITGTTTGIVVGATSVLTAWYDGVKGYAQVNNGTPVATANVTLSTGVANFTEGKNNPNAANYHNGRIYGRVFAHYCPSQAQREATKRYLARQAGCLHLLPS